MVTVYLAPPKTSGVLKDVQKSIMASPLWFPAQYCVAFIPVSVPVVCCVCSQSSPEPPGGAGFPPGLTHRLCNQPGDVYGLQRNLRKRSRDGTVSSNHGCSFLCPRLASSVRTLIPFRSCPFLCHWGEPAMLLWLHLDSLNWAAGEGHLLMSIRISLRSFPLHWGELAMLMGLHLGSLNWRAGEGHLLMSTWISLRSSPMWFQG